MPKDGKILVNVKKKIEGKNYFLKNKFSSEDPFGLVERGFGNFAELFSQKARNRLLNIQWWEGEKVLSKNFSSSKYSFGHLEPKFWHSCRYILMKSRTLFAHCPKMIAKTLFSMKKLYHRINVWKLRVHFWQLCRKSMANANFIPSMWENDR